MIIEIPKSAGKTDVLQLADLPKIDYSVDKTLSERRAIYGFEQDNFKYEFVLSQKAEPTDRIFVLFSGDAMRSKYDPPVFQRWSWADKFPGHCIYISDPTLHLSKHMGLAWYSGTAKHEPMQVISTLVREIADKLGVDPSKVVSYGSSGGGFAALRFTSFFPEAGAVAVNPQTDITKYEYKSVERYLKVCLKLEERQPALEKYPEKLSLLELSEKLGQARIVYIQNRMDEHHYIQHFLPFVQKMGLSEDAAYANDRFTTILFEHEGGHTKAETSEVFTKAMSVVTTWD